uniref:SFR19-like C-terminal domain-containing protein n=1 Tax=Anas zonorhyncha TaxID=75864 RepID=A0A8B9ZP86_9AVES
MPPGAPSCPIPPPPEFPCPPPQYLQKLHTQERAVEEVKLAIKPFYQRKEISKDEYKDILRKAVHKVSFGGVPKFYFTPGGATGVSLTPPCPPQICHSRSGEINPVKVSRLVAAYVQRYKYFRRRRRPPHETGGAPPDLGGALDKGGPPLPMPPL